MKYLELQLNFQYLKVCGIDFTLFDSFQQTMQHHFMNLIFSSSTVEVMKEAQLSLHQLNFVARYNLGSLALMYL